VSQFVLRSCGVTRVTSIAPHPKFDLNLSQPGTAIIEQIALPTLISKPELGSSYFQLSICHSTKLHNDSYAPNMTSNGPQEALKPSQETESLVRRLAGPSSGKAGFVKTSAADKLREF